MAATQSFFLFISSVASKNFIRLGGTILSGSNVSLPTYTVPAGRRLVVKGTFSFGPGASPGGVTLVFSGESTASDKTVVFGAGQVLETAVGSNNGVISGFLEDDNL